MQQPGKGTEGVLAGRENHLAEEARETHLEAAVRGNLHHLEAIVYHEKVAREEGETQVKASVHRPKEKEESDSVGGREHLTEGRLILFRERL